jgi:hypothetical protein
VGTKLAEVTFHIDESTSHDERESFRGVLLSMYGVIAAAYHDEKPHLMLIEYDPDAVQSIRFVEAASKHGLHAELIGF